MNAIVEKIEHIKGEGYKVYGVTDNPWMTTSHTVNIIARYNGNGYPINVSIPIKNELQERLNQNQFKLNENRIDMIINTAPKNVDIIRNPYYSDDAAMNYNASLYTISDQDIQDWVNRIIVLL